MVEKWLGLEGKVFIVTGGSSGIGDAIVQALCELDCYVVNADLREGEKRYANLMFVQTNIASKEDVDNLVRKTLQKYGKIDGVVNNAGINIPRLLVDSYNSDGKYELNEDVFDKMLAINLKGAYYLAQAAGRQMIKQKAGVILNMSSESGIEGSEGQSCYAATKAALNSLTRSWAKELGKYNVRVVGIAPGILEETGLRTLEYEAALAYTRGITIEQLREGYSKITTIPLGRSGKLAEVADMVCYFLSERAGYITGVTCNITGGKTRG